MRSHPPLDRPPARPYGRLLAAASGLAVGAAALGVGEFVAGLRSSWQSPVVAVAEAVIDRVPRPVKDFAIETFGEDDKVALVIGILAFSIVFAAVLGIVARRRLRLAQAGFAAFAAVGMWASQQAVGAPLDAIVPSLAAGLTGIGGLWFFHGRTLPATDTHMDTDADMDVAATVAPAAAGRTPRRCPRPSRRWPGSPARAAAAPSSSPRLGSPSPRRPSPAAGELCASRFNASASRAAVMLPAAGTPLPAAATGVSVVEPGVSPFFTPNADFYRVDTALDRAAGAAPRIGRCGSPAWSIRRSRLSLRRPARTRPGRGGHHAHVRLEHRRRQAGRHRPLARPPARRTARRGRRRGRRRPARRSLGRRLHAAASRSRRADGRPALIAVGMNGEPLPLEHGFPARLIVSGLYGYVSATKWLTEIELTRFDDVRPVLGRARVGRAGADQDDVAHRHARGRSPRSPPARSSIGGVAWAQTVGISKVEVAIDDGEFVEAELADELNVHTWRQWTLPWDAHAPAATASPSGPPTPTANSRPTSAPSRSPTAPAAGCPSSSTSGR